MNMTLQFPEPPPLGTALLVGPQRYDLIGTEPYQRKDGKDTTLLRWHTHCPDCKAPFIATSTLTVRNLNRRCEAHKRPGRRATPKGWKEGQTPLTQRPGAERLVRGSAPREKRPR